MRVADGCMLISTRDVSLGKWLSVPRSAYVRQAQFSIRGSSAGIICSLAQVQSCFELYLIPPTSPFEQTSYLFHCRVQPTLEGPHP